jgi:hypothetical protein
VHRSPTDCTRWTAEGLSYFLQECGFDAAGITTDSWGNRACLKANLTTWRKRGLLGSLANEPDFPLVVWAFAQRPPEGPEPLELLPAAHARTADVASLPSPIRE